MTKEDGNLRTYDDDGYKLRAGCVCVKDDRQKEVRVRRRLAINQRCRVPSCPKWKFGTSLVQTKEN